MITSTAGDISLPAAAGWRNHLSALSADWHRMGELAQPVGLGFGAVAVYRLQRMARDGKPAFLWLPVRALLALIWRLNGVLSGIRISSEAEIGPGLVIRHSGGIWVHRTTKIGSNCTMLHGVTIGESANGAGITIGDNVTLSVQATLVGHFSVGNNATVAANTLVISDVPAGATAIGVPAKFLMGRPAAAKPATA